MVVAERHPLEVRQRAELDRKFSQLVRVEHDHAQVDEAPDGRRDAHQAESEARLSLRTQVEHLETGLRLP